MGGGGGCQKQKFQGKYGAKLAFPDGWGGGQTKQPSVGGGTGTVYGYFLEQHISKQQNTM